MERKNDDFGCAARQRSACKLAQVVTGNAFIMQYQVLPSFMFGFPLTVFPRWMVLSSPNLGADLSEVDVHAETHAPTAKILCSEKRALAC